MSLDVAACIKVACRSVRGSDWVGGEIFLTNPSMVDWENSNPPPTYQSINSVDWLKILTVLSHRVKRVGQFDKCN